MKFNLYIRDINADVLKFTGPDFEGRTLNEARHLARGISDTVRMFGAPNAHVRIAITPQSGDDHEDMVIHCYSGGVTPQSIPLRHASWPKGWK